MNTAILSELRFFTSSFMWGAFLFVLYDCILIFRNVIRHKRVIIAVQDIIFWVVAGFFVFRMMYSLNHGTIRWYSIAGLILGMFIYNNLLSNHIIRFFTAIIKGIIREIKKFLRFIFRPFGFLLRKVKRLLRSIANKAKKRVHKVVLFIKKQLKSQRKKFKIKQEEKISHRKKTETSTIELDGHVENKGKKGSFELIRQLEEDGDRDEREKKEKKNRP